jgi:hypothetical protein
MQAIGGRAINASRAGGGGTQTVVGNYPDMMREIADDVTAALIPDGGH